MLKLLDKFIDELIRVKDQVFKEMRVLRVGFYKGYRAGRRRKEVIG